MRFLKRQTINRRQLRSTTVYSDSADANVYINPRNSGSIVLPSGTDAQIPGSPVNGMMRYNVDHDEVQVYQAGTWRSLRFKESTGITQQSLGNIDGYSYFYGPLNSVYDPTNIASGQTLGGQNVLVFIENVFQIFNTNYVITQNPTAGVNLSAQANNGDTTITVTSTATIPSGSVVTYGGPYIQSNTVATVVDGTTLSLSHAISGGNIPNGTALTFTAPVGYYVNFTSDPNYASMIGKPITVLLGFDQ
jgi:hypothetical protein